MLSLTWEESLYKFTTISSRTFLGIHVRKCFSSPMWKMGVRVSFSLFFESNLCVADELTSLHTTPNNVKFAEEGRREFLACPFWIVLVEHSMNKPCQFPKSYATNCRKWNGKETSSLILQAFILASEYIQEQELNVTLYSCRSRLAWVKTRTILFHSIPPLTIFLAGASYRMISGDADRVLLD